MFAAVMMDTEIAKAVLERILGVTIADIRVCYEKSIIYNPEYKGVRLDVEIEDAAHTHYDVEMQVATEKIFKRARFYHDQIDMELLLSGEGYESLPDAYVIFICDFDPVGLRKYRYTRIQTFAEDKGYDYQDGSHTVFLSTKGENDSEVSEELVKFLKYVGAGLEESRKDYGDELVRRIQESVEKVKRDREMGRRYMTFEEIKREEYKAGLAEGEKKGRAEGKIAGKVDSILDFLDGVGSVSQDLKEKLSSVTDTKILQDLLKKSVSVHSVEEFEDYLNRMNL